MIRPSDLVNSIVFTAYMIAILGFAAVQFERVEARNVEIGRV
jgi:hypothetical protein